MTNKATKYGLMTIAAVLLVAMAFAGAGAALDAYEGNVNLYVNNSGNWELQTITLDQVKTIYNSSAIGYKISSLEDLASIENVNSGSDIYILTQDIYCTELLDLAVISPKNPFTGTLIGNGYTIYNLTINHDSDYTQHGPTGLVGRLGEHGTLNYVNLTCANISSGAMNVGGLVGFAGDFTSNITGCNVMHSDIIGKQYVGGLVGNVYGPSLKKIQNCNVENCSVSTCPTGDSGQLHSVGGLFGDVSSTGLKTLNCYVRNCSITARDNSVGGLVGSLNSASFAYCNATNCMVFGGTSLVGGLVGTSKSASFVYCNALNCTVAGGMTAGGLAGSTPSSNSIFNGSCAIDCAIAGKHDTVNELVGSGLALGTPEPTATNVIVDNLSDSTAGLQINVTRVGDGTSSEYHIVDSKLLPAIDSPQTFFMDVVKGKSYGYAYKSYVNTTSEVYYTILGAYGKPDGFGYYYYVVTYYGNDNESGSVPVDITQYHVNAVVTVLGNTGNLAKAGYDFTGWNMGSSTGELKQAGEAFQITENTVFYANWSLSEYNITYNNMTGATNPDANPTKYNITSSDITLANAYKMGYTFEGWYNSTAFGDASRNNTIPAGSTGNKVFYANWTVNTTDVTASGNKAVFGNDNITAIHSESGIVVKVLLKDVSNVTDTAVNFTADNTTVGIIPVIAGYLKDEITIFDLNATAYGTAKINVTVTFANETIANATKDNIRFFHYNVSKWEPLTIDATVQNVADVLYTVETTSFSPFGIGIYTPITYTVRFDANGGQGSMADMTFTYDQGQNLTANAFQRYNSNFLYWTYNGNKYYNTEFVQNLTTELETVVMKAQWEGYSTGGSSSGSTYMGSNSASYTPTQQPTVKPTVAPTAAPTEQPATPTVIATEKPTTQATQQSPAPVVGLIAGLGAAAVLLRLRK